MTKTVLIILFIIISTFLIIPIAAQAVETRPAVLANSCAGCHGTDGKSMGSIPSIHGLKADYFKKTMKDFKDGTRKGTIMGRIAKGYSEEDISLMAEHFANLK